jgi:hypothetical protein
MTKIEYMKRAIDMVVVDLLPIKNDRYKYTRVIKEHIKAAKEAGVTFENIEAIMEVAEGTVKGKKYRISEEDGYVIVTEL